MINCSAVSVRERSVNVFPTLGHYNIATTSTTLLCSVPSTSRRAPDDRPGAYDEWLASRGRRSLPLNPDVGRYGTGTSPDKDLTSMYPGSEASYLHDAIPVACLTFPDSEKGAMAAKNTWGRHCNGVYLVSHKLENATIPLVKRRATSAFGLLCKVLRSVNDCSVVYYSW